ncbi:SACS [Mytilus edulis]|uniref:SACS n=1 Tax=Mytilus edulis TaxID=6550 RepID=A0A8S3V5W2_MYTED|nr:SACS [Mytilus edulis]
MKFTHPSISFDIAFCLGINTKRAQKWMNYLNQSRCFQKISGQHEELVTRIRRILSGYPCDVGVLKELLQNADDAKASEMHIVLDYNDHEADNLFSDSWKPLQGPSLLVYNDSSFSEADIKGIQRLGIGSKGDDPTKTGQYGVGFNAATPETPGRQYFHTEVLKKDHQNVFKCYYEHLLMKDCGTIFRLPLRTNSFSTNSKISTKEIDEHFIRSLISSLQEEMLDILLFANNLKRIKVSEIVDGQLTENYSVEINMTKSDEVERCQFYETLESCSRQIRTSKDPDSFPTSEVRYKINVNDSFGRNKNWLIVNRLGFAGQRSPDNVLEAYSDDNGEELSTKGLAYCFLPLPLRTGMPIHINGHFALDHEARRNLWTENKDGFRSAWNKHLMQNVIAPAYVSVLHMIKEILGLKDETIVEEKKIKKTLDLYHRFWPDISQGTNEYFKFLAAIIYRWISRNEEPVFPSYKFISETEVKVRFYPLSSHEMAYPCVFNNLDLTVIPTTLSTEVTSNVSEGIGERIASLQNSALISETEAINRKIETAEMSPIFLISFLKSFNSDNSDKCTLGSIGHLIKDSTFRTVSNLISCITYCKQSKSFDDQLDGLPLGLTDDGILRVFSSENPVFCSEFCYILKESSHLFLHYDLVSHFATTSIGIKPLNIESFADLLFNTLTAEKYRTLDRTVTWIPQSENIPNGSWIESVWKFLNSEIRKKSDTEPPMKLSAVQELLRPLLPWCLLPCTEEAINETIKNYKPVLYPINKASFILDICSFSAGFLKKAFEGISLPCIDNLVAPCDKYIMNKLIVNHGNPGAVFEYLHHYQNEISNKQIKIRDCYEIMEYLGDYCEEILKSCSKENLIAMVKSIPLHVNLNGHNVSIIGCSSILVLDNSVTRNIIKDGIEQWAASSGTILLRTSEKLKKLYALIGITNEKVEAIDIYTNHLLQSFDSFKRSPFETLGICTKRIVS